MHILGISAFYHDSAAVLVTDGKIIAAAQEERFTRKKHDSGFPENAIDYVLKEGGIKTTDLDFVAFYDKPFVKFERILETYMQFAPKGFLSFVKAMPLWIKKKIWIKSLIEDKMSGLKGEIVFPEHHMSHAASAFYPSPFEEAAVITTDGVGEWTTTSVGYGKGNELTLFHDIHFPHSLGLLYSAFTYYTGFKVNSGEYKVMGLAPYGEPRYVELILNHLIDVREDGSFRLNMKYFNYAAGLTMTSRAFHDLFGGEPRKPESPLTQKEMDLARSVQDVTELVMMKMARFARQETGARYLTLAGGVALNCVANGKILKSGIFDDLWIQPAAGDAGGALGAALAVWHKMLGNSRFADNRHDLQRGSYLGPHFSDEEILNFLKNNNLPFERVDEEKLLDAVADILQEEKVVGWYQGRMEFGPRALGSRSILGDPRSPRMQKTLNLKIKFRESFRPFAPSVLMEHVNEYFDMDRPSPYMLLTTEVQPAKRIPMTAEQQRLFGIEKLNIPRSEIPAVTHVDYSARIQTVHRETNPLYWKLLNRFYEKTGCPVVVNTSFNVRGEPIVCTPEDAYKCFMRTEMDILVMGHFILRKNVQPEFVENLNWQETFTLD